MIDLKRRFFIFGASALLLPPPPKSLFILSPPKLIRPPGLILPGGKLFDLPDWYSMEIGRKLNEGVYRLADIPRWVVLDKAWYDRMLAQERAHG
jgi:hypothetical protein